MLRKPYRVGHPSSSTDMRVEVDIVHRPPIEAWRLSYSAARYNQASERTEGMATIYSQLQQHVCEDKGRRKIESIPPLRLDHTVYCTLYTVYCIWRRNRCNRVSRTVEEGELR